MTSIASNSSLLAPRFLFRFELPLSMLKDAWSDAGVWLPEAYRLPELASLDRERTFADFRGGWSTEGLVFNVLVADRRQPPWCREGRLEDSDGLQVWIDTRPAGNVHRATQFCHRYVFLPSGGGRRSDEPVADQLLVNRARENARPVRPRELRAAAQTTSTGYRMACFIPAGALAGYDPTHHTRLGFNYAVVDRDFGLQTLSASREVPFDEDPSLWVVLELVSK
jgi:hypothetical protein